MCRYAMKPYKTSFVCVPCRHVAQFDTFTKSPSCPHCQEHMVVAGRDFQAPRKRNSKGWAAVAIVLGRGQNYDSCGCNGPGYRPRTKAQDRQHSTQRAWPKGGWR